LNQLEGDADFELKSNLIFVLAVKIGIFWRILFSAVRFTLGVKFFE